MAGSWQSTEEQRSLGRCMPIVSTLKPEQRHNKTLKQTKIYKTYMFCEKYNNNKMSAVKRLIASKNTSFFFHNICVCAVYIFFMYIYIMYIYLYL